MEKIETVIIPTKRVFFNEESGFSVYGVTVKPEDASKVKYNQYGNISISGNNIPELQNGVEYDVVIAEDKKSKYGNAYVVVRFGSFAPTNAEGQWKFLKALVTPNQYENIQSVFSSEDMIIDMIQSGEFMEKKVYGFGETTFDVLKKKVSENIEISTAMAYFSEYNVTFNAIKSMVKQYGTSEKVIEVVKDNPYVLTNLDGFGFKRVDEIAMSMGVAKDSKNRIHECIRYVIGENLESGHSWIDQRDVLNKTIDLLQISREKIENELFSKNIEGVSDITGKFSSTEVMECEYFIADEIIRRNLIERKTKDIDVDAIISKYETKNNISVSDEQKAFFEDFEDNNVSFLIGNAGTGKALKNGSKVQTPYGAMNIEDLTVGDSVFGADGKICNVLGVYPQGKKKVYEVEFSDGSVIECCEDHLWTYQTSNDRNKTGKWRTNSLKYIIENEKLKLKNGKYMRNNLYIPMTEPVEYSKKDLPIHPYLLGAMIGDGCLYKTGQTFTNSEEDIVEKVDTHLRKIGYELSKIKNSDYGFLIKITSQKGARNARSYFSQSLFDLELLEKKSEEKFIPEQYKTSCVEDRLELLKGLIDTDGHNLSSMYEYSTSSIKLARDVKELVESLGMTANMSIKENPTYTHNGEKMIGLTNYRLFIKTSSKIQKIHSSKKHEEKYKKGQSNARRTIREIRETNNFEEMTCISVDNNDKLFLTDNYIVTHNTMIQKLLLEYAQENKSSVLLLSPTGKASKVLTQATGKQAHTIHRRLVRPDSYIFDDVILVDEASMCDIFIIAKLLSRIQNDNAKIVFIGDDAQIPSVGTGNFLYDCIHSDVLKINKLTKVFRQKEGGILDIATKTREGERFIDSGYVGRRVFGKNCVLDSDFSDSIKNKVIERYTNVYKSGRWNVDDIVILTPTNVGDLGTIALNKEIQQIVNPKSDLKPEKTFGSQKNEVTFRVGDYVMNKKNKYDIEVMNGNTDETVNVFNGESGYIIDINLDEKFMIVDIDDSHVKYEFEDVLTTIMHSWVVTTYKAQGSEYKVVLAIVDKSATFQLNANLLYTAFSRAKEYMLILGQSRTLNIALGKFANLQRRCFLSDFLKIAYVVQKNPDKSLDSLLNG